MTPSQAIETGPELLKAINQRIHALSLEIDENSEQWAGLKRIGADRDDHAAQLLSRLRPILNDLSAYCCRAEKQINAFVADPFGRNE